jgi:hypothetical protein
LGGSGRDRLGACGALRGGGLELARLRPGPQALPRRRRPVWGRAASRHRNRGGSQRGRARTGCRCGRVRGNGSRRRTDRHLADRGRSLGHASAPGLSRRTRRHDAGGEGRGRSVRAHRRGSGRALRLPRSSTHRRAARICRSAVLASAPSGPRCRPRARARACSCGAARSRRAAAGASHARRCCVGGRADGSHGADTLAAGPTPAEASCAGGQEDARPRRRGATTTPAAPDGRAAGTAACSRGTAAGRGAAAVDRDDHEAALRSKRVCFDRYGHAPAPGGARPRAPAGKRSRSRANLAPRPAAHWPRLVRARCAWSPAMGGDPGTARVGRKRPP